MARTLPNKLYHRGGRGILAESFSVPGIAAITEVFMSEWNPKYLSGCVQHAMELLPKAGIAIDFFLEAAEHLESTDVEDCRWRRQQLKKRVNRLRRFRRLEPWEFWLLSAAEQLLQPIPGTKHAAVTMLGSAIGEHDSTLRDGWVNWHQQHATKEPAYL